ncbi:cytochrome P450 [Reyranella sp. CPCC 100927]|uniref:cytochrome P450 n=1 Tax=Reyranella sp. CPCC 100927 TaxID=2599616 RepID=UPI0011B3E57D|nr:cytochrome P450 [Reyranella sp. CPCC 100927]TWT12879.1 cytochrome P450 [Reyranella sp. CPCC 100927]
MGLLRNKFILTCAVWLVVRFARGPLRLLLPMHFRRELFSYDLPALQLVIGSSRDVVQRVLVRGAAQYPKSRIMKPLLAPLIGRGLFASEEPDVATIRRMFVRAIAQVDDQAVAAVSAQLLDAYQLRWRQEGTLPRLPVSAEMSRLTVDIVSECLFRTRFTEAESADFTRLFFRYQLLASPLRLFPWAGTRVVAPIRQRQQRRVSVRMRALIQTRFVDALRSGAEPIASSPFARAVAERERAGEEVLSDERLLDEVAVMLLAGHETSASALSWLMRELADDADVQARLRQEVQPANQPATRVGAGADTSLLRSLINEVLRLYPPIPIYPRDATTADTLQNEPIRPGALMLVSPWIIQRHAKLWDEPLAFKADRFRTLAGADTSNRFLPFGSGPRACPGSRFAMAEMQALVTGIVRQFQLRPVAGPRATPLGNLTTRPDREIYVALEPVVD